jgi:hypothetical protein
MLLLFVELDVLPESVLLLRVLLMKVHIVLHIVLFFVFAARLLDYGRVCSLFVCFLMVLGHWPVRFFSYSLPHTQGGRV